MVKIVFIFNDNESHFNYKRNIFLLQNFIAMFYWFTILNGKFIFTVVISGNGFRLDPKVIVQNCSQFWNCHCSFSSKSTCIIRSSSEQSLRSTHAYFQKFQLFKWILRTRALWFVIFEPQSTSFKCKPWKMTACTGAKYYGQLLSIHAATPCA